MQTKLIKIPLITLVVILLSLPYPFPNSTDAQILPSSSAIDGSLDIIVSDSPDPFNPLYEETTITITNKGSIPCAKVTLSIFAPPYLEIEEEEKEEEEKEEKLIRFWQWENLVPGGTIQAIWDGKWKGNILPGGTYSYIATCSQQDSPYFEDIETGTITLLPTEEKFWYGEIIDPKGDAPEGYDLVFASVIHGSSEILSALLHPMLMSDVLLAKIEMGSFITSSPPYSGVAMRIIKEGTIYLLAFEFSTAQSYLLISEDGGKNWQMPPPGTYLHFGGWWDDEKTIFLVIKMEDIGPLPWTVDFLSGIVFSPTEYQILDQTESIEIPIEKWSFAIITDLHIGRGYPDYDSPTYEDNGEGEDYYLTERLRKVVDWINKKRNNIDCGDTRCPIQFVAVLGDIADSAEKSEFCKAKEILDELEISYIPVFGNHDVWPYTEEKETSLALGQDYFDKIFWSTSSIPCPNAPSSKNFQTLQEKFNFKRDETNKDYKNFAFTYGGINFIGLDFNSRTHVPSPFRGVYSTAEISTGTESWLKDCLETHQNCFKGLEDNPYIIFSHIPFVESSIEGFSPRRWVCTYGGCIYFEGDYDKIKKIIKDKNVLANFGGHIHGFYPRPIIGGDYFMDANEEDYSSIFTTPVITTEALMVGSNEKDEYLKEHDKGIIKIVKVLGENEIDYKINEGKYKPETGEGKEFIALNPYITGCEYKSLSGEPCMIFKGHAFTKRDPFLSWEIDGEKIDSGEKIEYCFTEVPKIYEVKITAIDKENSEIKESIFRKILVKAGVIPKFLKGVKETVEVISTTLGEKLTEFGRTVKDRVLIRIKHSASIPVGLINVHFEKATEDIDLSEMKADIDTNSKKSILYMENWPEEIEKEKILFIPR
ncbi:MAG: metallophosphoesterase [Patescibacteria group bacterium]|nr:metallophosphoesterase [Patescibacteria group bacterium]